MRPCCTRIDLDQDRDHNEVNEVTDITETTGPAWVTPAHDRAGNMTTMPKPASPTSSPPCSYDAWNRMVGTSYGPLVFGKRYDGLNRQTMRRDTSGPMGVQYAEHRYYTSSWQLVETRTATSSTQPESLQPTYQYVWSPRYIDAAVLRDKNTDSDGLCDDQRLYFLNDANFNVTCLADTSGDALERYGYEPYGQPLYYAGDWSGRSYSTYDNQVLYTGREHDFFTAVYSIRNRWYHPALGRFVSRDPTGYRDGASLYVAYFIPGKFDPYGTAILSQQCMQATVNATNRMQVYDAAMGTMQCAHSAVCNDNKTDRNCTRPGTVAYYEARPNGGLWEHDTTLCYNNAASVAQAETAVMHELVHAFDGCSGCLVKSRPTPIVDCFQLACTEIRAHAISGDCLPGGPMLTFIQGQLPNCTYEQYVIGGAVTSVASIAQCTANASDYVFAMYPYCSVQQNAGLAQVIPWPIPLP